MANLMRANSEWANRPADERFWTLDEMTQSCVASREGSLVGKRAFKDLRAVADDGRILLAGPKGNARLTHYAFGQLATTVSAPAGYLRSLPAPLAATCLNEGLTARAKDEASDRSILFHKNGGLTVRALLSEDYTRVWDDEVCYYAQTLHDAGWRIPAGRHPGIKGVPSRAAVAGDILPGQINIREGDQIAPSGLYASDHDAFIFLCAPDRVVGKGTDTMMRGVFIRNSEVGDAALTFTFFMMQAVCGNHIVWSASNVHDVRVRHTGSLPFARARAAFDVTLRKYQEGKDDETRMVTAAKRLVLGAKKEDVLGALVKYAKTHSLPISAGAFDTGYETAVKRVDWYGDPNTLWANVAGLTEASQQGTFADSRNVADRAAGKLLAMVNP